MMARIGLRMMPPFPSSPESLTLANFEGRETLKIGLFCTIS
jgi:hypothetical protein